jgi:hypothetical protein
MSTEPHGVVKKKGKRLVKKKKAKINVSSSIFTVNFSNNNQSEKKEIVNKLEVKNAIISEEKNNKNNINLEIQENQKVNSSSNTSEEKIENNKNNINLEIQENQKVNSSSNIYEEKKKDDDEGGIISSKVTCDSNSDKQETLNNKNKIASLSENDNDDSERNQQNISSIQQSPVLPQFNSETFKNDTNETEMGKSEKEEFSPQSSSSDIDRNNISISYKGNELKQREEKEEEEEEEEEEREFIQEKVKENPYEVVDFRKRLNELFLFNNTNDGDAVDESYDDDYNNPIDVVEGVSFPKLSADKILTSQGDILFFEENWVREWEQEKVNMMKKMFPKEDDWEIFQKRELEKNNKKLENEKSSRSKRKGLNVNNDVWEEVEENHITIIDGDLISSQGGSYDVRKDFSSISNHPLKLTSQKNSYDVRKDFSSVSGRRLKLTEVVSRQAESLVQQKNSDVDKQIFLPDYDLSLALQQQLPQVCYRFFFYFNFFFFFYL